MPPALREADFLWPGGDGELFFRRMVGLEELGRLPTYRLELVRERKLKALKPTDLLGKAVGVQLRLGEGSFRYVHGWVTSFEQGGAEGRFDSYEVEIRPWLYYLTLSTDCKIFQNLTAVEIIEQVFADYPVQQLRKKLDATYRKRAFCVQYRESDFAFVSRLMEEEGIYYFFEHLESSHTLVLADSAAAHSPLPAKSLAWAEAQTDSQSRDDIITEWRRAHSLQSLKYVHTDYDLERPTLDLQAQAARTAPYPNHGELDVYDYPGRYDDQAEAAGSKRAEGTRLAKLRVDAFESQQDQATAVSDHRSLAAGWTFGFVDHPDAGDYLITRARFEAEFGGYEATAQRSRQGFSCRMDAVPTSVTFQPLALTPRPAITGPQTALVVGASGDEIHTDKFGRVKLQFRWDRIGKNDQDSSCWVRVSQPWASKQFGFVNLPRVGDEVVVEFLDGNPDRPLVTGRVYNGDNLPPYLLPDHATVTGLKTRSSKGGDGSTANELRFEDDKGKEYIWLQAEKDFHRLVENDDFDTVKNDHWSSVEKNSATKIGQNYTLDIGQVATIAVQQDVHTKLGADFNLAVVGALGAKVSDAVKWKGEKAMQLDVGEGLEIKAGQTIKISATSAVNVKGLGVVIDGGTQLTIKAGPSFVTLGPDGVSITGPMVKINSGGSAGTATDAAAADPAVPKPPDPLKANTDPIGP